MSGRLLFLYVIIRSIFFIFLFISISRDIFLRSYKIFQIYFNPFFIVRDMYFTFKLVGLAILVLNAIKLAPLVEASSEAEEQRFSLAKEYLCRYGYMYKNLCYFRKQKADDFLRLHAKPMREGLRLFQRYFNLTEDGNYSLFLL